MLKDSIDGVYRIARPASGQALPLVFDSPHSGRVYPASFNPACPEDILHRAEDNDVDILFASVPDQGGTLLCADFPRTFIDPNRAEDDLDPELIDGPLPDDARPGTRSRAGIGLVRRLVKPGMPVYDRLLGMDEVRQRIEHYYRPYHTALHGLVEAAHYDFGVAWHINCHSMPGSSSGAADFVLGDRDGTSCDPALTHALRDFVKSLGYRVSLNNPYKGVELVRRHGRPGYGYHSLQIEIAKPLYWNEQSNKRNSNYDKLKRDIEKLVSFCADWAEGSLTAMAAD